MNNGETFENKNETLNSNEELLEGSNDFKASDENLNSNELIQENTQASENAGASANADKSASDDDTKGFLKEFAYEACSVLVTSLVAIAIIFTFIFRLVGVRGDSMNHTLQSGDWLMVRPTYKEVEYKDIVIISQPNYTEETLVKRVIAVGGQKVDINFDEGIVYVDDVPLVEEYTATPTDINRPYYFDFPLIVPEGHYFVLGDNRNNSIDSRAKEIGMIEEGYVIGKAVARLFPFENGWDVYANSK